MTVISDSSVVQKIKVLEGVISFHEVDESAPFYQEMNTPFTISLSAFHPDSITDSAFSIFTPDVQLNLPALALQRHDRMHRHNCFEFTYILSGNMYQIVEGKRYLYTSGSCCLMNRNTLHTEELSSDYTCIFFSVSSEFIERLTNYGNDMLFPMEQKRFDNLIFHFLEQNMEADHPDCKDFLDFIPRITEKEQKIIVHDIFEKMLSTILNPYYGATYRLQDLFFQLIDILCDSRYYHAEHVTAKSNMESLLFSRIDQILDEHHGRISNKELSQLLNYNGTYLGKIVKKCTGQSLFDYSMNFTMKHAAHLLKSTKKSVSEIASELKFNNRTHFYQIFEKYYQTTPREYRAQQAK